MFWSATLLRPNSWTNSLLITVTSIALSCDFYFFKLTQPLIVSTVQLLFTVKEKGGKPDRKPSLWFKKSIQKPPVWELSRLNEIVPSWIRLLVTSLWTSFCVKEIIAARTKLHFVGKCQRKLNSPECLTESPGDNGDECSTYDQNMFSYTPRLHWSQQKRKNQQNFSIRVVNGLNVAKMHTEHLTLLSL